MTNDNPQQIIGKATGGIPESVQAISAVSKTMQRIRMRINPPPHAPTSLSKLVIIGPYSKTSSGEDFLLFDRRAVLAATRRMDYFKDNPYRFPLRCGTNVNALGWSSEEERYYIEGCHKMFSCLFGSYHPSILSLIEKLKKPQNIEDFNIMQFIAVLDMFAFSELWKGMAYESYQTGFCLDCDDSIMEDS
ncbi:hypothetical protein ILUMI_04697 [Ignelater luminosus]|uniref:Uncharacterized protein n=1 Tax=Ignelater luminosus TaxID=2038154 RepID=A0A8K0DDT7_IGNLU|nr:hypothetical protein ILUMI_04697 [Ignelater luminosus]